MRKSKPKKRILLPDPKFNDTLVTRFVNNLMYGGKKSTAYGIFYAAIKPISQAPSTKGNPDVRRIQKSHLRSPKRQPQQDSCRRSQEHRS